MFNKDDIMRIDYVQTLADIEFDKVALYNQSKILEDEVKEIIKSGEYNKNVIIIHKEQYESVFND